MSVKATAEVRDTVLIEIEGSLAAGLPGSSMELGLNPEMPLAMSALCPLPWKLNFGASPSHPDDGLWEGHML